ncbi:MAG TPA: alpha/beta hydrolase [Fimbriimonadaceae bacterium]|nr:alpha/beta hydrolase [Fimbriimonadaceae bacterium]
MLAYLALTLFGVSAKVETDVVYAKVAGVDLMMDVYHPNPAPSGKAAAVVVIHGGAWMGGKRQDMAELCEAIAKKGMLAATVQYRLAPKFKWPAMWDDTQTAVRYLRANANKYGIDPNRIGATGASAGGHLSLMLGSTDTRDPNAEHFKGFSSRVKAVLNLFGPTDMANDYPPQMDFLFMQVLGKPKAQAAAEIKEASPVTHMKKGAAAVFTIHGSTDPLVPVNQVKRLDDALKAAGVSHTQRIIDGMGHEIAKTKPEAMKAMEEGLNWLVTQLK